MRYVLLPCNQSARTYILNMLSWGNTLIKQLVPIVKAEGQIYAILPDVYSSIDIEQFDISSARHEIPEEQWANRDVSIGILRDIIKSYLNDNETNVIVFEERLGRSGEPWFSINNDDCFHIHDEIYYYTLRNNSINLNTDDVIKRVDMVSLFTSVRTLSCFKGVFFISDEDASDLLTNVSAIAIDAFDNEAFLYWFKDGSRFNIKKYTEAAVRLKAE